jgi:hypothetical protein
MLAMRPAVNREKKKSLIFNELYQALYSIGWFAAFGQASL